MPAILVIGNDLGFLRFLEDFLTEEGDRGRVAPPAIPPTIRSRRLFPTWSSSTSAGLAAGGRWCGKSAPTPLGVRSRSWFAPPISSGCGPTRTSWPIRGWRC